MVVLCCCRHRLDSTNQMVSNMNTKYRVVIWEYERGCGSKPFMHKDFDTKVEAMAYYIAENAKNTAPTAPDYYFKAQLPVMVDLDVVGTDERY